MRYVYVADMMSKGVANKLAKFLRQEAGQMFERYKRIRALGFSRTTAFWLVLSDHVLWVVSVLGSIGALILAVALGEAE